jgi:hypothetical protein
MRLKAGQRLHGKLSRDKKDWTYEALEEVLDACVYMSCALEASSGKAFDSAVADAEREVLSAPVDWTKYITATDQGPVPSRV